MNKKSLAKHYIGLHNESTFKKTATYGAFVCFSPATVSGGEFFIADGAKIFRDMKTEVLEDLYTRGVRISVSNLDVNFFSALGPLKDGAMDAFKGLVAKTVSSETLTSLKSWAHASQFVQCLRRDIALYACTTVRLYY